MSDVRLIDANALDGHKFSAYGATLDARERGWNECIEYLKARAKTIDAAPVVHAPWIETKDGGVCGRCRSGMKQYKRIRYLIAWCPFCGAKMDGGAST